MSDDLMGDVPGGYYIHCNKNLLKDRPMFVVDTIAKKFRRSFFVHLVARITYTGSISHKLLGSINAIYQWFGDSDDFSGIHSFLPFLILYNLPFTYPVGRMARSFIIFISLSPLFIHIRPKDDLLPQDFLLGLFS